jgi:hypothetical protein
MTDQRLHDLLHESVSDATMPDVADSAWRSGVRTRRRRTAGLAAGATAGVVAVAGTLALVDRGTSDQGPSTGPPRHSPSTSGSSGASPDARYGGRPVWWSPTLAQEAQLPAYPDSPLPATIDFSRPESSLVMDPVPNALAAFARLEGTARYRATVDVLGSDGLLRRIDIGPEPGGPGPVQPMRDPEGHLRIRAGASMLSPSGKFLMFPQQHSIRVMTLRTGKWRTVDTGNDPTWDATWAGVDTLVLPDLSKPRAPAPTYSLNGHRVGTTNLVGAGIPRIPLGGSQPYGRVRTGQSDVAQAFYPGADIQQPPALRLSPRQSDWIAVTGTHDGILLIVQEPGRQKGCCQVDGWIGPDTVLYDSSSSTGTRLIAWEVGTGRFWQVSRLTGVTLGQVYVVSSYAQFPAAGASNPR